MFSRASEETIPVRGRGRLWVATILFAAVPVVFSLAVEPRATPNPGAMALDRQCYLAMAAAPFSDAPDVRKPPFCWRILPSLLVWASGLDPRPGFRLLTLTCLAAFPPLLMTLLGAWRLREGTIVTAGALAAVAPSLVGYLSWSYAMTDALAVLLITAAVWSTVTRRGTLFILFLAASALTKETWTLAAAFAVIWTWRNDRDRWRAVATAIALAAVLHIGVRAALPAVEEYSVAGWIAHLYWPIDPRGIARRLLLATAGTWGVLTPLAALAIARLRRTVMAPALAVPIALSTAQILVATESVRPVAAAYPFVLMACAFELERLEGRWKTVLAFALVLGQIPWLLTYATIVLPVRSAEIVLVLGAAALALVGWRHPVAAAAPAQP